MKFYTVALVTILLFGTNSCRILFSFRPVAAAATVHLIRLNNGRNAGQEDPQLDAPDDDAAPLPPPPLLETMTSNKYYRLNAEDNEGHTELDYSQPQELQPQTKYVTVTKYKTKYRARVKYRTRIKYSTITTTSTILRDEGPRLPAQVYDELQLESSADVINPTPMYVIHNTSVAPAESAGQEQQKNEVFSLPEEQAWEEQASTPRVPIVQNKHTRVMTHPITSRPKSVLSATVENRVEPSSANQPTALQLPQTDITFSVIQDTTEKPTDSSTTMQAQLANEPKPLQTRTRASPTMAKPSETFVAKLNTVQQPARADSPVSSSSTVIQIAQSVEQTATQTKGAAPESNQIYNPIFMSPFDDDRQPPLARNSLQQPSSYRKTLQAESAVPQASMAAQPTIASQIPLRAIQLPSAPPGELQHTTNNGPSPSALTQSYAAVPPATLDGNTFRRTPASSYSEQPLQQQQSYRCCPQQSVAYAQSAGSFQTPARQPQAARASEQITSTLLGYIQPSTVDSVQGQRQQFQTSEGAAQHLYETRLPVGQKLSNHMRTASSASSTVNEQTFRGQTSFNMPPTASQPSTTAQHSREASSPYESQSSTGTLASSGKSSVEPYPYVKSAESRSPDNSQPAQSSFYVLQNPSAQQASSNQLKIRFAEVDPHRNHPMRGNRPAEPALQTNVRASSAGEQRPSPYANGIKSGKPLGESKPPNQGSAESEKVSPYDADYQQQH